jgi:hypothetical protein
MNVSTEDIRSIAPGTLALFPCEGGGNIRSARSLMSIVKDTDTMQDGVVDYESKKFKLETGLVLAIRALREGDIPIF